jgi:hypothetical protein
MGFCGASPIVLLASSAAVPACTARTPLAVPEIEANNTKAGCHGKTRGTDLSSALGKLYLGPSRKGSQVFLIVACQ